MGLFSKFGKNKQQSPEDSGYYRAADDRAMTERARSKRASSADAGATPARGRTRKEAPDPVLPEKKRARRRLVGAIALALAVAIGLPMVLDSEPKPLNSDIAIQIPPRDKPDGDKAAGDSPERAGGDSAAGARSGRDPVAAAVARKNAQAEALDQSEEIVEPEDNTPVIAPPRPLPAPKSEPKPARSPEPKAVEHKPEPKELWHEPKPEPKKVVEAKPEPKKPEPKPEPRPEPKPEPKHDAKPVPKNDDAARALALLEGKAAPAAAPADSGRFVIQVAALAAKDKVEELQGRLREAGMRSFTQKSPSGELTRVKVGPFGSREEAEKARARLQKIGLSGSLSPA